MGIDSFSNWKGHEQTRAGFFFLLMDDFRFYVLFNGLSAVSARCAGDNESLCVMEPHLRLKRSPPRAGLGSRES